MGGGGGGGGGGENGGFVPPTSLQDQFCNSTKTVEKLERCGGGGATPLNVLTDL